MCESFCQIKPVFSSEHREVKLVGNEQRVKHHRSESTNCVGDAATHSHGFLHNHCRPNEVKVVEWCAGTCRLSNVFSKSGIGCESLKSLAAVLRMCSVERRKKD